MNKGEPKRNHETFRLFFKSALITALCISLMCAFIAGILAADRNTKAASGNIGGFELYNVENRSVTFELFGTIYSVDLKPIFSAVNEFEGYPELVTPERRLEYLAIQQGLELLDRIFCQNK